MSALFSSKNARHQKDFSKTDHFKASRQKEPGSIYIRVLFDKEPGYMLGALRRRIRAISRQDPPAPCSKQQEARGLHDGSTFSSKKHTPLEDPKKRYMVSLKKALGRRLSLLGKTWRNKTRLSEFNHEVLGGLSMWNPRGYPARKRGDLV